MGIKILLGSFIAHVIGLWSKSDQAFIIDVYTKRVHTSNQNINTQVEFVVIYKQWVADVLADYGFLVGAIIVFGRRLNLI